MATGISNNTETAMRGAPPQTEESGSRSATRHPSKMDEQAFAAALEGGTTPTEKIPLAPPVTQADKPSALETRPIGQLGELPITRPAEFLSAIGGETASPDSLTLLERPIKSLEDSTSIARLPQEAKQPEISARESMNPSQKPSIPATPASDTPTPNMPTANADGEPTRRTVDSKAADDKTDPNPTAAFALGDSILRGLQGQSEPEPAAAVPAAAPESKLSEIAEKVAARILVADRSTGAPEVRITLHESFLNGAELRIHQDGGQTVIEFHALSPESQNFLQQRGDDLQKTLQERLGGEVRVEIRSQDASRDNPNGRSRQHRSMQDEWEAER